jgi:TPR repeat protein
MTAERRGGLRKPIILTAAAALAAPIMLADVPSAATIGVYAALLCIVAWWTRYFFYGKTARTRADSATYHDRGLEAERSGDFAMALQWLTLAANLGHAGAMNEIGLLHMNGSGVSPSTERAIEWFQKAIAHGERVSAPANLRRAMAEMHGSEGQQQSGGSSHVDDSGRMTRTAALEVFDLKEGATAADIRSAYVRLMRQVHPDKGGSNFFAKQLNEARNLLLAD